MAFMATQALLPFTQPSGANDGNLIAGFETLKSSMMISSDIACELHMDLVNLGACDVRELGRPDWLALPVWGKLREMERRRLLIAVGLAAA